MPLTDTELRLVWCWDFIYSKISHKENKSLVYDPLNCFLTQVIASKVIISMQISSETLTKA